MCWGFIQLLELERVWLQIRSEIKINVDEIWSVQANLACRAKLGVMLFCILGLLGTKVKEIRFINPKALEAALTQWHHGHAKSWVWCAESTSLSLGTSFCLDCRFGTGGSWNSQEGTFITAVWSALLTFGIPVGMGAFCLRRRERNALNRNNINIISKWFEYVGWNSFLIRKGICEQDNNWVLKTVLGLWETQF